MMEGLRQRIWTRLRQTLWFQPALASALAGCWVVLAIIGGPLLPGMDDLPIPDKDTIVDLLKMGGGSLLTIATVTLSVLMVVLNAAAGQASPRALPGLMSDRMTHRALAAFIGGFVYAVTGVVVLGLGRDGDGARLLIGAGGLATLSLALYRMVLWFHHIADLLKLSSMIDRIFRTGDQALDTYRMSPAYGLRLRPAAMPALDGPGLMPLYPRLTGHLRLIDVARLAGTAETHQLSVIICHRPGTALHPQKPMAMIRSRDGRQIDDALRTTLIACFDIGRDRTEQQDPLLCLELLCETACRALSPGINDPETAIICLDRLESLLTGLVARPADADAPADTDRLGPGAVHVVLPPLPLDLVIDRALMRIARCGADAVEVSCHLLQVLEAIARTARDGADADVARAAAVRAHAHAAAALVTVHDRQRVDAALAAIP